MLRVGFSARRITPRVGQEIPGLFSRRHATGVHDDLYARAVIIDDGAECVAFAQIDAMALPEAVVSRARRLISKLCGVRGRNCMIAATHTHSGGPVCGAFLSEPDEDYARFVARETATAVAEAYESLTPSLVGIRTAIAPGLAFNRRFRMKDGSEQTHPGKLNPAIAGPAGPADSTVTVVGFCDPLNWRPTGCVVHFACHCTHMNGVEYSADYCRWIVDTLRAVYGPEFGVVYLNGACGDVTQVDNRSRRPLEIGPYWCERTGRGIAGGAISAISRMDWRKDATVAADSVKMRAQIRETSPSELKAARELLESRQVTADDVETIYARELLEVEKMRQAKPYRLLEIGGARIGDTLFWGAPAELFQAFALEAAVASPFPRTCCVGLANGYNGYICTPGAFAGGGYEIRTARSSFLEPGTGARVVAAAKKLAVHMRDAAEEEVFGSGARSVWPHFEDNEVLDGIRQITE